MNETPSHAHPLWVRIILGQNPVRRAARFRVACWGGYLSAMLVVVALEWGGRSHLGKVGFILGLAAAVLGAVSLLWTGLAMLWVDRKGRWA